jgi:hypothetical protein
MSVVKVSRYYQKKSGELDASGRLSRGIYEGTDITLERLDGRQYLSLI